MQDFDFTEVFGEVPAVPGKPVIQVPPMVDDAPKKAVLKKGTAPNGVIPGTKEIELYEWQSSHFYKIAGEYYPSVTTILSVIRQEWLEKWRGNQGNENADMILKKTGEDGSSAHWIFHKMVTEGKTAVFSPDIDPKTDIAVPNQFVHLAIWKLTQFWNEVRPQVIASEVKLFSPTHLFAGTADLIIRVSGGEYQIAGKTPVSVPAGIWLADIKTGKNISALAGMQMAAYAHAIEETMGLKLEGAMILHTQALTKTGIEGFTVKMWDRYELQDEFEVFLNAQKIYNYMKPLKPKDYELPKQITLPTE